MTAVIQRVTRAQVDVEGQTVAAIGMGLLTLLGVARGDTDAHLDKLVRKIAALRIFEDAAGKMNLSLADVGGEHLIVSQFTLLADVRGGRRPSFTDAEEPAAARAMYEKAIALSRSLGIPTAGGRFKADMQVTLVNDGPVTLIVNVPEQG